MAKTSLEEEERRSEECDERSVIRLTALRVSRPRAGRREPRKRACQEVAVGASYLVSVREQSREVLASVERVREGARRTHRESWHGSVVLAASM